MESILLTNDGLILDAIECNWIRGFRYFKLGNETMISTMTFDSSRPTRLDHRSWKLSGPNHYRRKAETIESSRVKHKFLNDVEESMNSTGPFPVKVLFILNGLGIFRNQPNNFQFAMPSIQNSLSYTEFSILGLNPF